MLQLFEFVGSKLELQHHAIHPDPDIKTMLAGLDTPELVNSIIVCVQYDTSPKFKIRSIK